MALATVTEIIDELKAGRFVILVDEEDRENEGDLVIAADFITPEAVNFMARHARGLICLTLTESHCKRLGLGLMSSHNGSQTGTAFTLSIEAATGVTTGISAADRCRTVQAAVAKNARPEDIVAPGHIFPVMARPGGVLERAGHTEAGCDLTHMAGLTPASVICEIMNEDGTMARLPELIKFATQHQLKIGAITDLIAYRSRTESLIERIGKRPLATPFGQFDLVTYREKLSLATHLALVKGEPTRSVETLVRVHEPISLIDLLETESSTHSWSVAKALGKIAQSPCGAMLMLHQPESAEALAARALNASGSERHSMNLRTYGIGAQILRDLGVGKMRVMARPTRMPSMSGFDLEVTGYLES